MHNRLTSKSSPKHNYTRTNSRVITKQNEPIPQIFTSAIPPPPFEKLPPDHHISISELSREQYKGAATNRGNYQMIRTPKEISDDYYKTYFLFSVRPRAVFRYLPVPPFLEGVPS